MKESEMRPFPDNAHEHQVPKGKPGKKNTPWVILLG
jgi:hypothetical protein